MNETTFTCPACGDVATTIADPLRTITRCDMCDARVAYGEALPNIVIEPGQFETIDGPRPAFVIRVQDPTPPRQDLHVIKIDPHLGFLLAQSLISMVRA